jgi:hypothetical protein
MAQGAERELRSKEHVISELDTLQNAARKKGISSEPNTSCSRKEAEGFFHLCVVGDHCFTRYHVSLSSGATEDSRNLGGRPDDSHGLGGQIEDTF